MPAHQEKLQKILYREDTVSFAVNKSYIQYIN